MCLSNNLNYFNNVNLDSFTLFVAGLLIAYILDNLTTLILSET